MPQSINIQHFQRFIDLLEKFQKQDNCLLNLNKLFDYWEISSEEIEPFIQILMSLQSFFGSESSAIKLYSTWKNGQIYLRLLSPSKHNSIALEDHKEIELTTEECHLLNDIVHFFEHINIGKEFNSKATNSEFLRKIKKLKNAHPYFFESRGNGAFYPTKIASQLGKTIRVYKKGNRSIQDIKLEGYQIRVK